MAVIHGHADIKRAGLIAVQHERMAFLIAGHGGRRFKSEKIPLRLRWASRIHAHIGAGQERSEPSEAARGHERTYDPELRVFDGKALRRPAQLHFDADMR